MRGSGVSDPAVTHDGQSAMRLEPEGKRDARVQSAPIALTIGKSYQLSGWIRTDRLTVRDLDRSPIATGAALGMASLPFDVESESVAGTRDWTRVELRFTATRAQDSIVLAVAYGGTFDGKAWFSGVTVEDAPGVGAVARAQRRHHLWSRLSLPGGRMDLSSRRRPALRARLSAWPPDGQRDSAIHGALRRRAGSQRQEQELESGAHHRHRAIHARFRPGNSGRNERHRRRRLRCRCTLGRPPHRSYRHRRGEHHCRTRRIEPGADA